MKSAAADIANGDCRKVCQLIRCTIQPVFSVRLDRKEKAMKQRYIKVNRELIPVTEEVYQVASRMKENERHRARRDGKCGQSDYRYCSGDCGTCGWYQEGHQMLSMSKVFVENPEYEMPEKGTPLIDDIIANKLLLEDLYHKLDELMVLRQIWS